MTKITKLAFNRKFTKEGDKYAPMERREKIIPPFTKKIGMCPKCNLPVWAGPGQIINSEHGVYYHKKCRK